jgi:hypothetical protein
LHFNYAKPLPTISRDGPRGSGAESLRRPSDVGSDASIVKLAQIVRVEAAVGLKTPKPKTIEDVLAQIEQETSVKWRRAFEGFLKKMDRIEERQGR